MRASLIEEGAKYGKLTVVRDVGHISVGKERRRAVLVSCECGRELVLRYSTLKSGNTRSCGCIPKGIAPKPKSPADKKDYRYLERLSYALDGSDLIYIGSDSGGELRYCTNLWFVCTNGCRFRRRLSVVLDGNTTCPCKSTSGFKQSKPAVLYLLCVTSQTNMFYKFGISNNLPQRLSILRRQQHKNFEVVCTWEYLDGGLAALHERHLKNSFSSAVQKEEMEDGWTETIAQQDYCSFLNFQTRQFSEVYY